MRSLSWRQWALVLLSALLQLLPFPLAGPVAPWRRLFCWVALVPLLLALSSRDRQNRPLSFVPSALLGYGCGVAWFFGNCYWIYQTMFFYGGLPPVAAAGILILFSLYLGLYFALFGGVFALLRRFLDARGALLLSPLLWVGVELARARITGFPWDLLGYTQVGNAWLAPMASVTGVMGLSLLVAAGNVLWLWRPLARAPWAGPALALALAALQFGGEHRHVPPSAASARAVLLQDNLSVGASAGGPRASEADLVQSLAGFATHPEQAPQLAELAPKPESTQTPPALIAWPEAPTDFSDDDPQLRQMLGNVARAQHAPMVVDAVGVAARRNAQGRFDEFVSASFYLPNGAYAGRYDKMHLVPFGEYTPYKQLFFFAGHLLDGLNFVPGKQRRLFHVDGRRYGIFICYESIFGEEIRHFALNGAQAFVNLSDDGWYGDTSAPWEHLDMARMRAIENDRWLLRDTNTGLTASIDPRGRIVAALPRHVRAAIEVPFGYRDDLTFYTRHGDWIGWLSVVIVAGFLVGAPLQRRYAPAALPKQ